MSQLKNVYQTLASFGSRVQVTLHESLNFNDIKGLDSFWSLCALEIIIIIYYYFKRGLFYGH